MATTTLNLMSLVALTMPDPFSLFSPKFVKKKWISTQKLSWDCSVPTDFQCYMWVALATWPAVPSPVSIAVIWTFWSEIGNGSEEVSRSEGGTTALLATPAIHKDGRRLGGWDMTQKSGAGALASREVLIGAETHFVKQWVMTCQFRVLGAISRWLASIYTGCMKISLAIED